MQLDQRASFLREDEQTGGIAIQAVGELEELGLRPGGAHGLDDAIAHAAPAVDGHTGGLVDHEDRRVFISDRQIERPCRRRLGGSPDRRDAHPVAGLQPVVRLHPAAVHPHFPAAQDPVDVALRHALQGAQQEVVDALRLALLAHFHRGRLQRRRCLA